MTKNDTIRISIESLDFEGKGVGRLDGRVVFVPGALPGEQVEALVIRVTASYAVGKLLRVLVPSPERVTPPCPYYEKCGGCSLMHLSYAAQLAVKRQTVTDALRHIGAFGDPNVLPVAGMDEPFRYRNKVQLPVAGGRIGMFSPRSHRLVPVEDCLIGDADNRAILSVVERWLSAAPERSYDEISGRGLLRHLVIKSCTGGRMIVLVANGDRLPDEKRLTDELLSLAGSVYLCVNRAKTNVILGRELRLLGGREQLDDVLLGLHAAVGPLSFRQVNSEQTEKLYTMAVEAAGLSGRETVFDAYCGAGVLSLLLARHSARVIGVEIVPEAVEAARANALRNGVTNAEFFCGACETVFPRLIAEGTRADAILLDPPRKGCEESLLHVLAGLGAPRIVYISCNPATLARDAAILAKDGYGLVSARPVDMFPHTAHVETVVQLVRKKPDTYIDITVDMDELDLTSFEAKATYDEIKDYIFDKYHVKVSSLYIAQVKQRHGIIERDCYNNSKKDNPKQHQCPPEKVTLIEEALRHFKMIP
ncbi:MAG: 23S rRNA (uracil(1939)-C(5))-methyltransferase RlmD [Eubacteriales bacterium]|nr:23S rRNA (uracil(1939)-C(5))-methyltransferase RlmD [Eubacteriales bacterium]